MSKKQMRLVVWEPRADSDDLPMVDGIIDLDESEARDLSERLDRFSEEDIIQSYELYDYEVPSPFTVVGVYATITGDVKGEDEDLRAVWEGS